MNIELKYHKLFILGSENVEFYYFSLKFLILFGMLSVFGISPTSGQKKSKLNCIGMFRSKKKLLLQITKENINYNIC